jgi:hypothetical protein
MAQQVEWLPTVRTGSFFATASGGIGWAVPAAAEVPWLTGTGASPGRSSA